MSQSTRGAKPALITLATCTVLFVLVAWFVHTYERVARRVDLPPVGEAAWNPLYVLKQALRADGVAVEARPRLDLDIARLGRRDTLVLLDDPRYLDAARASALLDWVARGGHLVVRAPPGEAFGLRESMPLLEALKLEPMPVGGCERFQVRGQPPHVEFCGARRFGLRGAQPVLAWGNLRDGYVYARLARGQGFVDVLADVDFLQNGAAPRPGDDGRGLRAPTHQVLARQVLAPNYGHGTMHLVYATQMPSLWRTLVERGWPVSVPLLLALLAWMALRAQRFGPLQPPPAPARRSLLEHVRASGEHLYRYRREVLLYAAARGAFLARLRRSDPVAAALSGAAQADALARRFDLPAARVARALQTPTGRERREFADRISLLMSMRQRL
ncbi:DUF4350 domain-containing protein [Pseudoxanthomonas sp. X-1]|uniref:DUF4350 domain-containing protein n=1 Tax=Pseudoxanthomonas sp. X-1 TaxID=2571115 RepID=UPI00110B30EB|nr:DUF4350 domain-containing protein [Pseudoxanthomonas sp. X-1]TMN25059.1 DUF4350 domain-containing protein [Pseudoxanthomonas sp. X-1]UAY74925.1 DUF4350 domain-containing protein [Pseudoxanthomonas sp. X-1]